MKVACPNCGAENNADAAGEELVCFECFTAFSAGPGVGPPRSPFDDADDEPTRALSDPFGAMDDDDLINLDASDLQLIDDESSTSLLGDGGGDDFEVPFGVRDESTGDMPEVGPSAADAVGIDFGDLGEPPEEGEEGEDGERGGAAAFLFERRRRRALSETDVAMIGTYQRRSAEMQHGEDVVWTGDSPPPGRGGDPSQRAAAAPNPTIDPFGSTEVVWNEAGAGQQGSTASWNPDGGGGTAPCNR